MTWRSVIQIYKDPNADAAGFIDLGPRVHLNKKSTLVLGYILLNDRLGLHGSLHVLVDATVFQSIHLRHIMCLCSSFADET
jgi:hypothetical protein